jgi:hypothetical protein
MKVQDGKKIRLHQALLLVTANHRYSFANPVLLVTTLSRREIA